MELPNKAKANVPRRKLVDYLLSETHAVGKAKAKFFRSLGFDETTVSELEDALLMIAQTGEVKERMITPHGVKYVVDAPLSSPRGVVVEIRTIWIVEPDDEVPRFVTAYPLE
ncbi:MAG: hypothetical protein NZ528_16485 [Caldilineales bacterium]|nr:hypothetical protein [Caldilineales bacterium]